MFGQLLMTLTHTDKTWIKGMTKSCASRMLLTSSLSLSKGLFCQRECSGAGKGEELQRFPASGLLSEQGRWRSQYLARADHGPRCNLTHHLIPSSGPEHRFNDFGTAMKNVELREAETSLAVKEWGGAHTVIPTPVCRTSKTILSS